MTDKLPAARFPPYYPIAKASDPVNKPAHYTKGKHEAIEIIEDVVAFAPSIIIGGLHWQVMKYLLRLWHKDNPLEDAKKARWYLNRLIEKLESK